MQTQLCQPYLNPIEFKKYYCKKNLLYKLTRENSLTINLFSVSVSVSINKIKIFKLLPRKLNYYYKSLLKFLVFRSSNNFC